MGFAGDMNILGVQVDDLVNSGNYYDIVQLQDSNHFDKSWDIKEDILTFKAKANIDSGRPARQPRLAGGQAEAELIWPAHQYGSVADSARERR